MSKIYKIKSRSNPNYEYSVELDENGFDINCNCPHYTYRHKACYHVRVAQKLFDVENKHNIKMSEAKT